MIVDRIRWHAVADDRLPGLAEGALLHLRVHGRDICFVRSQGVLHALADRCPHQGKRLSGGWCDEGYVVCPWHRFHFDPASGRARHGVCANVEVFPVEERTDGPFIGFPYTTFRVLGMDLW
ncbi:MAG: Rieske (2Fe-2S) protein [Flavobacteriales bacterium]|nr:Rieske (2Fe-2S) protein [Flavobacteriales bacterium]MCB9166492.1 Rieske (2Fe-2S) protein [Flavobacteriales bacterium]